MKKKKKPFSYFSPIDPDDQYNPIGPGFIVRDIHSSWIWNKYFEW